MGTLHGILAELGIENPDMHPERGAGGAGTDARHEGEGGQVTRWVVDEDFIPQPGKTYEIAFGRVPFGGQERHVMRRVRVEHVSPSGWIDQETGNPLDPELAALPVKAFRVLD